MGYGVCCPLHLLCRTALKYLGRCLCRSRRTLCLALFLSQEWQDPPLIAVQVQQVRVRVQVRVQVRVRVQVQVLRQEPSEALFMVNCMGQTGSSEWHL